MGRRVFPSNRISCFNCGVHILGGIVHNLNKESGKLVQLSIEEADHLQRR